MDNIVISKREIKKAILFLVIGILVISAIIHGVIKNSNEAVVAAEESIAASIDETTSTIEQLSTSQAENTETSVPDRIYKLGEEISLDEYAVTVTKVEKSLGDEWDKPKDGYEYVIVYMKFKNTSNEIISYWASQHFKMQNSKGQIESARFISKNKDTRLDFGELAPDGEIEGSIAFEQPKNDADLTLIIKSNMFSNNNLKMVNIN